MELFTTATLWKNYDRRAQPLDVTVINVEKKDGCTIEYDFFNGDPCADGCVRIFSRFYLPDNSNGAGVVLMNDVMNVFDETYVEMLTGFGYNVLVIDYVGKRTAELYTVYPHSLKNSNYFVNPDFIRVLPDNPKESCWYVWATLMLRGVTFLESRSEITGKISVFGVKTGAFQVWKAAYVEKTLACGIALFNSGYIKDLDLAGMKQLQYNTCIDNAPYAGDAEVPVLAEVASNAKDDSIEYMSNLSNNVKNSGCFFSIGERRSGLMSTEQMENIELFLENQNFGGAKLPSQPEIVARESGREFFYDIKADSSLPISEIKLFVSQGDMPFSYKNWHQYPVSFVQDGAYIAKVDIYAPKEKTCAFVTVKYKENMAVSSELIQNTPFLMKVRPSAVSRSHLLYSVDDGTDDWTVLGDKESGMGSLSPYMATGEYNLRGVTSDYTSLSTFKFGESRCKLAGKSFLQITVYAEREMRISVTITSKRDEDYLNFTCVKHVHGYEEWLKINLQADEFRCGALRLDNFDDISCFTIESDGKLLLNSVIMV